MGEITDIILIMDGYELIEAGCWMLDAGYWMLDTGCWMLDTHIHLFSRTGEIRLMALGTSPVLPVTLADCISHRIPPGGF
jgi:hypothetical protein